jgi:hypothetical protein
MVDHIIFRAKRELVASLKLEDDLFDPSELYLIVSKSLILFFIFFGEFMLAL